MRKAIERDAQQEHIVARATVGLGIAPLTDLSEGSSRRSLARLIPRGNFHLNNEDVP